MAKIEEIAQNGCWSRNLSRLNAITAMISGSDDSGYEPIFEQASYRQNQQLQQRERKKEAKKEREKLLLFFNLKNLKKWSRQWGPPSSVEMKALLTD